MYIVAKTSLVGRSSAPEMTTANSEYTKRGVGAAKRFFKG